MLTKRFPFLLPYRVAQRKAFFYAGMGLDGRTYAKTMGEGRLTNQVFVTGSRLYNPDTGFDMTYQENKVFNLQLVAKKLDGLLIRPGETFSYWQVARHADKQTPYKDGLVVRNGVLGVAYGGGLCQMSNLLFWMFLHSPLTIVERHTHSKKDFPSVLGAEPEGVDATISEGWIDLKMKNETDRTFQIAIDFEDEKIVGSLLADKDMPATYEIEGRGLCYFRENDRTYQEISIYRREMDGMTGAVLTEYLLYINRCEIGYALSDQEQITERSQRDEHDEQHAKKGQKEYRHPIRRLFA